MPSQWLGDALQVTLLLFRVGQAGSLLRRDRSGATGARQVSMFLNAFIVAALTAAAGTWSWGRLAGIPEVAIVTPASAARPSPEQGIVHLPDTGGFLHRLMPAGRAASRDLLQAAERKDFESVRALAASGDANVNAENPLGWTALTYAVDADDAQSVRLLLELGADPNTREHATGSRQVDVGGGFQQMLRGNCALHLARSAEITSLLLDFGANLNAMNEDGSLAIHFSSADKTRVLLERGADPNSRRGASRSRGISYPGDEESALMTAAALGKQDVVRVLLAAGADVNARSRYGSTALHRAARASAEELFRLNHLALIHQQQESGVVPKVPDPDGSSLVTLRVLLESGAEPNVRDSSGRTPLMEAALGGGVDAVELLLARGADPSICDADGTTALVHLVRVRSAGGPYSRCSGAECDALIERLQVATRPQCTSMLALPTAHRAALTSGVVLGWVQVVLDIAVAITLMCSPLLCMLIVKRSQRHRAPVRIAYLGYALCALVIGVFQLHLWVDGPEYGIALPFYLIPILIAGMSALWMTVTVRSNAMLWVLGCATLFLGLLNLGQLGLESRTLAHLSYYGSYAYVLFVAAACVHGRSSWGPASDRVDA